MRIALGRRGDYAVRAVIDIARHWSTGRRKTQEIALAMDIPVNYLSQILADLVSAGLLDARAGPAGGYMLARPPAEITLLDAVIAGEGPLTLDRCVLAGGPCDWGDVCPVHDSWASAQDAFMSELDRITMADLSEIDARIQAGTYQPSAPRHGMPTDRAGIRD